MGHSRTIYIDGIDRPAVEAAVDPLLGALNLWGWDYEDDPAESPGVAVCVDLRGPAAVLDAAFVGLPAAILAALPGAWVLTDAEVDRASDLRNCRCPG